jgi:hypothetical protein
MSFGKAVLSGLVGACALTLLNETARQFVRDAPRIDVLGKRAIAKPLMKMGVAPPKDDNLYWITLASDIFSNTLYFGSIGFGNEKNAYRNGALLGLAAGIGAVALPAPLGLGTDTTARTGQTELMTVAWYLAGGLATAAVYQLLSDKSEN